MVENLSLNTIINTHVLQSFSLNTKHQLLIFSRAPYSTQTSHQSCASGSTPNTRKHIYIICNWLTPNITNKSSCSHEELSLTQYIKIVHQHNIIINGAYAHKCSVQNSKYYTRVEVKRLML